MFVDKRFTQFINFGLLTIYPLYKYSLTNDLLNCLYSLSILPDDKGTGRCYFLVQTIPIVDNEAVEEGNIISSHVA